MIITLKQIGIIVFSSLFFYINSANAVTYEAELDKTLQVKISKTGLNRITNPPYKIVQVTGDDSKFRLKYDEDGANIYVMPVSSIGENIEISIKNNVGLVQDLELHVSNIKGQSIIIDGKTTFAEDSLEKKDIAQMLRAMKDGVESKFYVQSIVKKIHNLGILLVEQKKIYKYKNLTGGIFEITNPTKSEVILDVSDFTKKFDHVKSSYPAQSVIAPKQITTVLVVQKSAEK